MSHEIDELDERILYHLAQDARNTAASDIAREMEVSGGTIRNRIEKLEEAGVVRGYHAAIDYEACSGLLTNLFLCSTSVSEQDRLARRVLRVPGVVNVREVMTGHGNLRVKAVGEDTNDLTRVARKLTNLGLDIEDEDLLHDEHHHAYHQFGPESAAATVSTHPVERADDDEIRSVTVDGEAPIAGQTLQEANKTGLVDEDVLVVAIERGETTITPRGDTRVQPGDRVRLFSPRGVPVSTLAAFEVDESTAV
ncbi:Lrp/AsnC family transcriptional regulator [Halospeciosus flavus]|uniref:TrkA C-terminal domain-containing protein n=1 Tax=Halospeciosus flavus TaxID=3032283 RepID=A0ABD5Z1B5_9EURY|nr:Lrp/AsnC family transcriptional regulator [Halospeciosus flavus]